MAVRPLCGRMLAHAGAIAQQGPNLRSVGISQLRGGHGSRAALVFRMLGRR